MEDSGPLLAARIGGRVAGRLLSAAKEPVPDGSRADFAIVVAPDEAGRLLHLVELQGPGVARSDLPTLDPSRAQARVVFEAAPSEPLPGAAGWGSVRALLDDAIAHVEVAVGIGIAGISRVQPAVANIPAVSCGCLK